MPTSVRDALDSALVALGASGVEQPRLDAELLLADALGCSRAKLISEPGRAVEGPAVRAFRDGVRRRSVEREPVAYILGTKGFRYLDIAVDPRVLIPRPETELLVDVALPLPHAARVLDVGTGSGAIALAVKHERPDLEVHGTDISEASVQVATANAERLELEVGFVAADLFDPRARFDAILSNPPYIPDSERASLEPEITRHEPAHALFAGADGLDVIRRLVARGVSATRLLALEVGHDQGDAVAALMREAGFGHTELVLDLAGIPRVVIGRR